MKLNYNGKETSYVDTQTLWDTIIDLKYCKRLCRDAVKCAPLPG